jgi:HD-GYP domain-containing protein (c-di-GMP phosphodiesterase class II)
MDEPTFNLSLFDLVMSLSTAADLVSPTVANHQRRVACIALSLAEDLGFSPPELSAVALAGSLHDIGIFTLRERISTLDFELTNPGRHAELGYLFLHRFEPLSLVAEIVRYHHHSWQHGEGSHVDGRPVPASSFLVGLADRLDTLINPATNVLSQAPAILRRIGERSSELFVPQHVEALRHVARRDTFWLDIVSPMIDRVIQQKIQPHQVVQTLDELTGLAQLFSRIIDFKSAYTSTHSAGVAVCAATVARLVGFSLHDCTLMRIAGYLHDIGKLAIPGELLDKSGELTEEEYSLVRSHAYYTRRVLDGVAGLGRITDWAASHHERLDGQGYPSNRLAGDLSLSTRIIAAADVFTALAEDRPYRPGLAKTEAVAALQRMGGEGQLDPTLVELLVVYFDEVNDARRAAQQAAAEDYMALMQSLA